MLKRIVATSNTLKWEGLAIRFCLSWTFNKIELRGFDIWTKEARFCCRNVIGNGDSKTTHAGVTSVVISIQGTLQPQWGVAVRLHPRELAPQWGVAVRLHPRELVPHQLIAMTTDSVIYNCVLVTQTLRDLTVNSSWVNHIVTKYYYYIMWVVKFE